MSCDLLMLVTYTCTFILCSVWDNKRVLWSILMCFFIFLLLLRLLSLSLLLSWPVLIDSAPFLIERSSILKLVDWLKFMLLPFSSFFEALFCAWCIFYSPKTKSKKQTLQCFSFCTSTFENSQHVHYYFPLIWYNYTIQILDHEMNHSTCHMPYSESYFMQLKGMWLVQQKRKRAFDSHIKHISCDLHMRIFYSDSECLLWIASKWCMSF